MKNTFSIISAAAVKRTYHLYAPVYDFLFGAVLEPGRKALAKEVLQVKPNKLLEVGVGTGLLLPQYPSSTHITGVDISEDMLNVAHKRVQNAGLTNIQLLCCDGEKLDFPDNTFDCVVMPYVLSVTPDPSALVSETRRVCMPNGTIIIVNHFSGSHFWRFAEKIVSGFAAKIGFRSEFSYEEQILTYNWKVLKLSKVNLFGLSKLVVIQNDKY